jgi:hypothetical protein
MMVHFHPADGISPGHPKPGKAASLPGTGTAFQRRVGEALQSTTLPAIRDRTATSPRPFNVLRQPAPWDVPAEQSGRAARPMPSSCSRNRKPGGYLAGDWNGKRAFSRRSVHTTPRGGLAFNEHNFERDLISPTASREGNRRPGVIRSHQFAYHGPQERDPAAANPRRSNRGRGPQCR